MAATNKSLLERLNKAVEDADQDPSAEDEVVDLLKPGDGKEKNLHKLILDQVEQEYQLAWSFMRPKRQEWLLRLKLYNNQKRDKNRVGDTLLFSVFQTVFANLYEDNLGSNFNPREPGDDDRSENLTELAEYDKTIMEKDIHDYEWDFDALFTGKGYSMFTDFDTETKTPIPEVWDPMLILLDPSAKSVQGVGPWQRGEARFFGREVNRTKYEMERMESYFNLGRLKKAKDTTKSSMTAEAAQARSEAMGLENMEILEENIEANYKYRNLQWFTHVLGEKYLVELSNDRKLIVRIMKMPKRWKKWPLVERSLFPISHELFGVSIPDLIEDKQRMRAVLLNLGIDVAKSELYPRYIFDQNKIRNPNSLTFGFNKHIPSDGPVGDAMQVVQSKQVSQTTDYIMRIIESSAERAAAVPAIAQGIPDDKRRTLGENELLLARAGGRQSLAARIFGWSEKRFWYQWYWVYDEFYAEGLGEKVIRINGPFGPKWLNHKRQTIIMDHPLGPDIHIESQAISEARKLRDFGKMQQFLAAAFQDPTARRRFAIRHLGRMVAKKQVVDRIIPPTIDEMEAEEENKELDANKKVPVSAEQNHWEHLEIHGKLPDPLTQAAKNHIRAHKEALMLARTRPDLFPGNQAAQFPFPDQQGAQLANPASESAGAPNNGQ